MRPRSCSTRAVSYCPASPQGSRMAPRTAPLHLRCAESSTPAGSPIAAINAHSGRGVVRPPRSFLAHRPLGRLFFRFSGPISCSSSQRLRFAQSLARRRMAAQRFRRLLTLSDLISAISAISAPVLRSVIGSAQAPLRLRSGSAQAPLRLRSGSAPAPLRLHSGSTARIVAPAATRGCGFGGDDCSLC